MICISLLCIHIHLYGKAGDFFIAFWLRFIKLDEGRKLAHTKWRKVVLVLVVILVVGCTSPSRNSFIEHSQYTHQQQSLCQTGLKREGSRQSGAQGTSFGLLVLSPWLDLLAPEFERKTAATNSIFPLPTYFSSPWKFMKSEHCIDEVCTYNSMLDDEFKALKDAENDDGDSDEVPIVVWTLERTKSSDNWCNYQLWNWIIP